MRGSARFSGFRNGKPILSCWLSRMEFKASYFIAFVAIATRDFYGGDQLTEDEAGDLFENTGAMIRYGMNVLYEAGYHFDHVLRDEKGRWGTNREVAPNPKNELFLEGIRLGRMPDPEKGLPEVVSWLTAKGIDLPFGPLMDAWAEIHGQLEILRKERDPEEIRSIGIAMEAALGALGIQMVKRRGSVQPRESFFFNDWEAEYAN